MLHRYALILLALTVALPATTAQAELFKRMHRDYRRNNCWPQPFIVPDRIAARAPFGMMINNGWRAQNTLTDDHFDSETGLLNEAGELKVRDVLTMAPIEHRTVYVLRATKSDLTEIRNRSVQDFVARISDVGDDLQVADTRLRPRGSSADYINTVNTRFNASTPEPRLPSASGAAGGAGGAPGR